MTSSHKAQYIGRFEEAQPFLQDNDYIKTGYRIGYNSFRQITKTLFMFHNQTMNIWTHLLAVIVILFFILEAIAYQMQNSHTFARFLISDFIQSYQSRYDLLAENRIDFSDSQNSQMTGWPIMVFLFGAAACLGCSTVYHWLHAMSQKTYKITIALDYAGIGMNMAFSPFPAIYYSLYCQPSVAFTYMTLILIGGVSSFAVSLLDVFQRQQYKIYKNMVLIFSSVVAFVALIHMLINKTIFDNFGDQYTFVPSVYLYIPAFISYGCGFYFYSSRCPERKKPGKFDICGHSHQFWHVLVVLGVFFTYCGHLVSYEMRRSTSICPI